MKKWEARASLMKKGKIGELGGKTMPFAFAF
jgi:hypothetical protein